jgi:hypothetical protein
MKNALDAIWGSRLRILWYFVRGTYFHASFPRNRPTKASYPVLSGFKWLFVFYVLVSVWNFSVAFYGFHNWCASIYLEIEIASVYSPRSDQFISSASPHLHWISRAIFRFSWILLPLDCFPVLTLWIATRCDCDRVGIRYYPLLWLDVNYQCEFLILQRWYFVCFFGGCAGRH